MLAVQMVQRRPLDQQQVDDIEMTIAGRQDQRAVAIVVMVVDITAPCQQFHDGLNRRSVVLNEYQSAAALREVSNRTSAGLRRS